MGISAQKYIRKPLYVDAVRITEKNFEEMVLWSQGTVEHDEERNKKFIRVRVHQPRDSRQTKAFVGDWLLYTEMGYKIYTNRAFENSFDLVNAVKPESIKDNAAQTPEESEARDKDWAAETEINVEAKVDKIDNDILDAEAEANRNPTEDKRVLSVEEQDKMSAEEIREAIQSGEVVLAQDAVSSPDA